MAKKKVTKNDATPDSRARRKRPVRGDATGDPVIVGPVTLPMFAAGDDFVLTLKGRNLHAVDLGSLRLESELGRFTISRRFRPLVHDDGKALTIWGRYARARANGGIAVTDRPPLNAGALTVVYVPPPPKGVPKPPRPNSCPFPILAFAVPFKDIRPWGYTTPRGALVDTYRPPVSTGKKKGP